MTHRILILGGTTEARELAGRLAGRAELSVTISLAGRTVSPVGQPVPIRSGGFGGADGLAAYLRVGAIDLMIDATHPYAATMSRNAAEAARASEVRILALRRAPWKRQARDRWIEVDDGARAVQMLGEARRRVFLALGRQEIAPFEAAPQHAYVVRSVDPVEPPLTVPDATYILGRGPFAEVDERALLQDHRIDAIVAKNSGGAATYGKIAAARALGIAVILFRRPVLPEAEQVETVEQAAAWVDHWLAGGKERGV